MEPLPTPPNSMLAARRILVAAAVIHVFLFVYHFRGPLAALAKPRRVTTPDHWGPFATGADCVGYYAWLRAPLIHGDFHFDEELAPTIARLPREIPPPQRTATGHLSNGWSVGPALVWAPAVVGVHLILKSLGRYSPWPADGFAPPYQVAVGGTTLVLALLTLALTYRIGRRFASAPVAATAAALVTLGTPVVGYGTVEVTMAHGPATTALTLFTFVWLKTFGDLRAWRWIAVGGLLGIVSMMRWQLATFALLPILEALWLVVSADGWATRGRIALRLATIGLAAIVAFVPQLAVKQIVFGDPFGGSIHPARNWLNPALWQTLFSTDRSLFYWTPVALFGFTGVLWSAVQSRRPAVVILAIAVLTQIYALSAMLGGEVYLGWSFGFRFLTETCALLVPGIAALLANANSRTARWFAWAGGILVWWNLNLLGVYRNCLIGECGADPWTLLELVGRFSMTRPLEAVATLAASSWLTYLLVAACQMERQVVAISDREFRQRRLAG